MSFLTGIDVEVCGIAAQKIAGADWVLISAKKSREKVVQAAPDRLCKSGMLHGCTNQTLIVSFADHWVQP